ncbi:MAG: hypothetical protein KIT87_03710 [Anaerolineae bacterium]|nr:hypothetical protein [Anaerolineae bacterium]
MDQSLDHFGRLLEIAADLDQTQRRSFSIAQWMRAALVAGVVLTPFDIYWSLAVVTANMVASLINAETAVRKYKRANGAQGALDMPGKTHDPLPGPG